MDEDKLKKIVEDVVNKAIDPINQRLDDPDNGLHAIKSQLDAASAGVATIEQKINAYGDMYKMNDSNIRKMEKRLETVEEKEDIDVPPELQLEPLQEVV